MADAKRNKLVDAYAAVRDAAKERQGTRNDLRHNIVEQIPQSDNAIPGQEKPPAPKTRDIRAKAAGTNAKYNGRGQEKPTADLREVSKPKHTRTSPLIAVKCGLQNRAKEADV